MRKPCGYIVLGVVVFAVLAGATLPLAAVGQIAPAQPSRPQRQPSQPPARAPAAPGNAAPSPAPAPSSPADEKLLELTQRAQSLAQSLHRAIGPREQLFDPEYRKTISIQAVPLLKDTLALADEFTAAGGQGPAVAVRLRYDAESMLAALDDPETVRQLQARAGSGQGLSSNLARQALAFGEWIKSNGIAGGQHRALDAIEEMARETPANDGLTQLLLTLLEASPANADVRDRIMRILSTQLTGPMAKLAVERVAAQQRRAALEGKPLLVLGVRFNREMFSSRIWQGRVVMVVFWDSTNKACQAEVPHWVRLFEQFNKDGLEIIGVSCDANGQDLLRYKATHRKMAWPELFDTEQPGWHALATELGVTELPTVMLIDKNGVCRSSDAGQDLEPQIRRLLAE